MEKQYGIIEAKKPEFTPISLLVVPSEKDSNLVLTVGYPAFGPNYFSKNIKEMQKNYSHPQTGEKILFRKPTTRESVVASAYKFEELAKPEIFNPRWLQAGHIVRTSEGVYFNPLNDKQGNPIIDEKILRALRDKSIKVNGIYLGENDFSFAPYETFKQGVQEAKEFAESGLARGLEHTENKIAKNLELIANTYPKGVNVFGFDSVKTPVLKIVVLYSSRDSDDRQLDVDGDYWDDDLNGAAFGVLDIGEANAKN